MKKIPLRIGVRAAFFLSAFFLINFLHAQNYEIEKYFDYYGHELDRLITYSEQAESYEEYTGRLEIKFNVLKALWEKDRDRLKSKANESEQSIEPSYEEWEREADARISRSKAAYIIKNAFLEEGGAEELKRNLSKKLQEITISIAALDSTKGEQFEEYKRRVISAYKGEVSLIEGRIDRKYDIMKQEFTDNYGSEGIQEAHLHTALEEEKHRVLYEKKVFLAALVSSSVNRIKYDLFADQRSLRLMMEKERAKKAADEIQLKVKEELERSVEERLDALLRDDVLSREDVMLLSKRVNKFYDQGLEIWAQAAADLVRKENEWYQNYNDVYNEGTSAWATALNMLKNKKEEWADEFLDVLEEGLQKWDAIFEGMYTAKDELLSSLMQFRASREKDFDVYINHLAETLGYGSQSIGQIDEYTEEFHLMMKETLSPFTQEELSTEQVRGLMDLFDQYDGEFWHQDRTFKNLFNFETTKIWVSNTSKTDKIIGKPRYFFLSSEDLKNGFRLKVEIEALVRRYDKKFVFKGLKGMIFTHKDINEKGYYWITCTYDKNGSWKRAVSHINHTPTVDTHRDTEQLNVTIIADELARYADIIDSLHEEKRVITGSIHDVQESVLNMLDNSKTILENPLFADEEELHSHYFGEEKEFLWNDFDRELYRAYYEKEFWASQYRIIEGVLEYALDKAGREDAQDTIDEYERAQLEYELAVEAYEGVLEQLRNQEGEITALEDELETLKETYAEKEKALRELVNRLSSLTFAEANLDMLVYSMYEQINRAVQQKHTFLERIWGFDEYKEEEAVQNLIKGTLQIAGLRYEKLFNEYFDPDNKTSLVSMKEFLELFHDSTAELFGSEGEAVSGAAVKKTADGLGILLDEMEGIDLYSEITGEVEHLKQVLDRLEADSGEETQYLKPFIAEKTSKGIYLVQRMFHSLIEGKKQAYAAVYEYSSDPGYESAGNVNDKQEEYFSTYIEDVKQYIQDTINDFAVMNEMSQELEEILRIQSDEPGVSEMHVYIAGTLAEYIQGKLTELYDYRDIDFLNEEWLNEFGAAIGQAELINQFSDIACSIIPVINITEQHTYHEAVDSFIEGLTKLLSDGEDSWQGYHRSLELFADSGSTVNDLLITVRDRAENTEAFLRLKHLFIDILPHISSFAKLHNFECSRDLELNIQFCSLLLPEMGQSDAGEDISFNIEDVFLQEFSATAEVLEKLFNPDENSNDLFEALFERLREENNYYGGDDITPIDGAMDFTVLYLLLNMDTLETNGMLTPKLGSILLTMAEYVASYIYLDYNSEYAEGALDESAFGEPINEKIICYFDRLKAGESWWLFSEEEQEKIEVSMERFLVSAHQGQDEGDESIQSGIVGMSTERLRRTIQDVNEVIDELSYFYDIHGYFTMVLEREGYEQLEKLDSLLLLEIEGREEYENKLEYSEKFKEYSSLPSESRLKEVLDTQYISDLLQKDRQRALDLICALSFQLIASQEIPGTTDFAGLYFYIEELVDTVLDIRGSEIGNYREDIKSMLETEVKLYEAELKRSGEYYEEVTFSSWADAYISVLESLDEIIERYKNNGHLYLYFHSFLKDIYELELVTDLSEEEVSLLKQRYADEGRYLYSQKYFVANKVGNKDEAFKEKYLEGFAEGFQDYLLQNNVLSGTVPCAQAYRQYLLCDPVETSFFKLADSLYRGRDILLESAYNSTFKQMIENKISELVNGEYEDYRGVIYETRDIWHSMNKGRDRSEVSVSFNYRFLEEPSKEQILSRIYFEGFGEYSYKDNEDNDVNIDTAITYISGNTAVNSYIEHQNRFLQSLVSLIHLKEITEESALNSLMDLMILEAVDEDGNPTGALNLNIFSGTTQEYADIDTITGSELKEITNVLAAVASDITIMDRDGQLIINERPGSGELLYMLASVKEAVEEAEEENGDVAGAVKAIEDEIDHLEEELNILEGHLENIELDLIANRNMYNSIIDQVNKRKSAVDEAYHEYLKAKEIYYYARNIYFGGGDTHSAVQMYKEQLLDYTAKKAESEERYRILKDIKMTNRERDTEEGYNHHELAGYYDELNEMNESVNEAEEALQLLKIFHSLFTSKLGFLESKRASIEESLESDDLNDNRRDEYSAMIKRLDAEIDELKEENDQYISVNFTPGSTAYTIFSRGLKKIAALNEEDIDKYITALGDFISEKGENIFTSTRNRSLSMMVVELEDYVLEQHASRQAYIEEGQRRYSDRYGEFTNDMLSEYTNYRAKREEYVIEKELTEREIGFLAAGLNEEERIEYEEYLGALSGKWDELNLENIHETYHILMLLESRLAQLEELIIVYSLLTGFPDEDEHDAYQHDAAKPDAYKLYAYKPVEENKKLLGEDLEKLGEKYGITDEDILSYDDIIKEGILLDGCDFSGAGVLRAELGMKKDLLDELEPLDYYTAVTGSNLFSEMLKDMKQAYMMIGGAKEALEEYRFELQIGAVVEEKNRFHDKVTMGKENGLEEWDNQFIKIRGEYRKWVSEMKERFDEVLEEWSKKEVEYVRKRDEWVKEAGENSLLGDNEGFSALEDKIQDLTDDISISVRDMSRNAEALEQEYSEKMPIPQWISDYQVLANTTFGRLKKAGLSDEAVEESIRYVRENMEAFEDKKESLEAEKLYFKLKKAQETILAEIRSVDEMNRMMVDEVMEEAKFTRKGSGYERRILVDYSLLGGKKKETKKIGLFSVYRVDEKQFSLAGIEDFKSLGDSTDLQIFIMKETERLRRAKEEALGTKEYAGDIYKKHIGRFPTGEDIGRYIEEKQEKKGILGNVKKFFGKVMKKIISLFVKEEKNKEDYSDFQKLLVKEIQYPVNRGLETGRIMLEYQRLEIIEAEAKENADSGFFNAPLFPGGPSLKSIGNVALSIATGGASAVVRSAVQIGWNVVTTVTTAAEGKMDRDEAVLNIMKDIAITAVTGGFSKSGSGIGEISLKDLGSLSNNIKGAAKQAAYEAKRHMINQAAASAVNAIELDDHGRLGWNSASFGEGIGTGMLTSVGRFGGSFAANTYDLRHGATWSGSGYNYNYMKDIKGGGYIADYFNTNMKRMGGMLGGLTEQGINNMTGMSDGLTLNVLNSRDFGLKNEVGMVTVTLGGSKGFDWDVSRGGMNVSASGIKGMYEGMERVKLYNEVMNGGNKGMQVAYMADNKSRYSYDTLSEKEKAEYKNEYGKLINEIEDYLHGNSEIGFNFNTDKNMRKGDTIFITDTLVNDKDFKVEDGLIHMDLNKAAKMAPLISHELMHDGKIIGDNYKEDVDAHTFDTIAWRGLKEKFGVHDVLMDEKLFAFKKLGKERFNEYLDARFRLGEEAFYINKEGNVVDDNRFFTLVDKSMGLDGNVYAEPIDQYTASTRYEYILKKHAYILNPHQDEKFGQKFTNFLSEYIFGW